jgi:hypothetical protein
MNPHRIIAPRITVIKLKVSCPREPRYLVMNPHCMISIIIHRKMLASLVGLLLYKNNCRKKMAAMCDRLM